VGVGRFVPAACASRQARQSVQQDVPLRAPSVATRDVVLLVICPLVGLVRDLGRSGLVRGLARNWLVGSCCGLVGGSVGRVSVQEYIAGRAGSDSAGRGSAPGCGTWLPVVMLGGRGKDSDHRHCAVWRGDAKSLCGIVVLLLVPKRSCAVL